MAVVMLSIFTLTAIGIEGSIHLQLAHGITSSALFAVVTILYDRHHTRIVRYYRGVTITMPIFSILFLFFTLSNIAVPLSSNFIGEFVSLLATFESNPLIAILSCAGIILSACYSLFLYNRVAFGAMSPYIAASPDNRDVTRREFYLLAPLVLFTFLLGIFPNLVFSTIDSSVLLLLTYLN
jgi:NADH-ubiquinone oxidoreductase chain 4